MSRTIANALGGTFALLGVVVIGSTVAWSNIVVPAGAACRSKAQLDQAFVDVGVARPQNTAPNREKLREIGWKHLNAAVASKVRLVGPAPVPGNSPKHRRHPSIARKSLD